MAKLVLTGREELSRKFGMTSFVYNVVFPTEEQTGGKKPSNIASEDEESVDIFELFQDLKTQLDDVAEEIKKDFHEHDHARFALWNENLETSITTKYIPVGKLTGELLLEQCEIVLQSKKSLEFNKPWEITAKLVRTSEKDTVRGALPIARRKLAETTLSWLARSTSFIPVSNFDNYCLARSLILAKAYVDQKINPGQRPFDDFRKNENLFSRTVKKLMKEAGLDMAKEAYDMEDLDKMMNVVGKETYMAVVFSLRERLILKCIPDTSLW